MFNLVNTPHIDTTLHYRSFLFTVAFVIFHIRLEDDIVCFITFWLHFPRTVIDRIIVII